MPVPDLIRDSFVGQLIYYTSGQRLFLYEEEKPGFMIPLRYCNRRRASDSGPASESATLAERTSTTIDKEKPNNGKVKNEDVIVAEREDAGVTVTATEARHKARDVEKDAAEAGNQPQDPNIVDWYGPDDPECPFNVGHLPGTTEVFLICDLTFIVVIRQTLFCNLQSLCADIQYLYRRSNIRTRY